MNSVKVTNLAKGATTFLALISLAAVVFANISVFARIVAQPAAWSDELLRAVFVWVFYLGVPFAYVNDKLIGITVLEDMLLKKEKYQLVRILKLIQAVSMFVVAAMISYQGYLMMKQQFVSKETTAVLMFPSGIITFGFVLGMVCLTLCAIYKFKYYVQVSDQALAKSSVPDEAESALEKFNTPQADA